MLTRVLITVFLLFAVLISPALAAFCPACGIQADEDDNFCRSCGKSLKGISIEKPGLVSTVVSSEAESYRTIPAAGNQPQAFQVLSHFLNVSGNRLYRNSNFWIAEVSGSQARVWSPEGPPYDTLIMGWVPLSELEKRTTLLPGTTIVCSEPPLPMPSRVIVVERVNFWRNWGPDPFYPFNSRCPYRRR